MIFNNLQFAAIYDSVNLLPWKMKFTPGVNLLQVNNQCPGHLERCMVVSISWQDLKNSATATKSKYCQHGNAWKLFIIVFEKSKLFLLQSQTKRSCNIEAQNWRPTDAALSLVPVLRCPLPFFIQFSKDVNYSCSLSLDCCCRYALNCSVHGVTSKKILNEETQSHSH